MKYELFLILAICILTISVVTAIVVANFRNKFRKKIKPISIVLFGAVLAAFILFIPVYNNKLDNGFSGAFEIFVNTFIASIKLFGMGGDYTLVVDNLGDSSPIILKGYSLAFSLLFILIPLCTVSWVLSFFKGISARIHYGLHFWSDTYIFSRLNEKSITLAESFYENNKKRCLVFLNVNSKDISSDLTRRAENIYAITFSDDFITVPISFRSKKSVLNFFCIDREETKNTKCALEIIKKFGDRQDTNLYVFSTLPQSELLFSNVYNNPNFDKIKVRRINEVQSIINQILYYDGFEKIFKSAKPGDDGLKKINAIILGMGKFGTEMAKSLTWFGQMDGYSINIDVFDVENNCEERFTKQCPELMKFSGVLDIEGETKYTLNIHGNMDVNSVNFDKAIMEINDPTYVLVVLGDDELNISAAVSLRTLLAKKNCYPQIQAVVYDTEKNKALKDITNFKKQPYDIDLIGDLEGTYSENVILGSEIENAALKRHLCWGEEKEFWQYDYNYRSSIASAIHRKMKILCGIEGAEKPASERTEAELLGMRVLEHLRWNAYVRSEGYTYGGTTNKSGRNDLAKIHNCLVPFAELPLEEQIKDDY